MPQPVRALYGALSSRRSWCHLLSYNALAVFAMLLSALSTFCAAVLCLCHYEAIQVAAKISGHTLVQPNNELALKNAVAQQPVSVQIEADTDLFRLYKSGLIKDSGCGTALDHVSAAGP